MSPTPSKSSGVQELAEVLASLSIATDLGIGQPMEFALSSCILAVRLAKKCGYSEEALREVYYQALLRYIGCNAESDWLSSIAGDEQIMRADFSEIDSGDINTVINMFTEAIRKSFAGKSPRRLRMLSNAAWRGSPASRPCSSVIARWRSVLQNAWALTGMSSMVWVNYMSVGMGKACRGTLRGIHCSGCACSGARTGHGLVPSPGRAECFVEHGPRTQGRRLCSVPRRCVL